MALIPGNFNSDEHDDMGTFEAIPAGEYTAMIVDDEIKPTKKAIDAANGNADLPIHQYNAFGVNLKFQIIGGDFDGRQLFNWINLKNPNAQAVELGSKEISTIARACGKILKNDTSIIHRIPMKVKIGITPASANYAEGNKFISYERIEGSAPVKPDVDTKEPKNEGKPKKAWD